MARAPQINYQRVTFSFPAKTLQKLRKKMGNQNMSKYVAELVEEKMLEEKEESIEEFMKSMEELRKKNVNKSGRSSLEILREIRYGKE